MIDWFFDNWQFVVYILISLVCLFLAIFKKKIKVVDAVEEFILEELPLCISFAESAVSGGSAKKALVEELLVQLINNKFPSVDAQKFIDFIDNNLEKILSTPQKKGDL